MSTHINSLPDLCLLKIFSSVPVRDLLRVGRVCTKWRLLQQSVGLNVRKLTIVIGELKSDDYHNFTILPIQQAVGYRNEDGTVMYPQAVYPTWDTVHFKYLDLNALNESLIRLPVIFPNVATLQVGLNMISMLQLCTITNLLRLWHTNLTAFTLFVPHGVDVNEHLRTIPMEVGNSLIQAINSLSALKHLSLHLKNIRVSEYQLILPILAQLDRFDYNTMDKIDNLFYSFAIYAVKNATLRLKFDSDVDWSVAHSNLYGQLGQRFCAQFERLPFGEFIMPTSALLNNFCVYFCSLTSIEFTISDSIQLPLRAVFSILSQLTQLVHLSLSIESVQEEDEDAVPFARLVSLKSLDLYAKTNRHDNLARLNSGSTMPNLQIIHVNIVVTSLFEYRCSLCGLVEGDIEELDEDEELEGDVMRCLSQVMMPLRHCTRLHTISFASEGYELKNITLDDLSRPLILEL